MSFKSRSLKSRSGFDDSLFCEVYLLLKSISPLKFFLPLKPFYFYLSYKTNSFEGFSFCFKSFISLTLEDSLFFKNFLSFCHWLLKVFSFLILNNNFLFKALYSLKTFSLSLPISDVLTSLRLSLLHPHSSLKDLSLSSL